MGAGYQTAGGRVTMAGATGSVRVRAFCWAAMSGCEGYGTRAAVVVQSNRASCREGDEEGKLCGLPKRSSTAQPSVT